MRVVAIALGRRLLRLGILYGMGTINYFTEFGHCARTPHHTSHHPLGSGVALPDLGALSERA